MNVVIVAGGLGSRFGALSIFPKILLPSYNSDSILKEDCEYFHRTGNKVYCIINEKFYDMVNNYIKVNKLDVILIKSTITTGAFNTIKEVEKYLPKTNILTIWSDLVLNTKESITDIVANIGLDKNIIFTLPGKYRYTFENKKVKKASNYNGNLVGIYYFPNGILFNKITDNVDSSNYDIADYIIETQNNIEYFSYEIDGFIEYKDYKVYENYIKEYKPNNSQTRFFNSLIIDKENNTVTKKAIDESYYPIIEKEYKWYEEYFLFRDFSKQCVCPKVYSSNLDNHEFTMEYLKDYIPLHCYLDTETNKDNVIKVYNNIKENIDNNLHSRVSYVTYNCDFNEDLYKEVVVKVIDRCEKIKHMLITYNKDELNTLLNKVANILYVEAKESPEYDKDRNRIKYYFCHGDLNGSNTMVNPKTLDVKFLDPRGYFGLTKLYGWNEYEYAKLLYCLEGYDDFNLNKQIYGKTEPKTSKWLENINYLNKRTYKILVGVIYIALAGYISQDIMKANIAYDYGIKYLKKALKSK